MEATQFRFVVSQKRGNIAAVTLFMLVFTIVMLVMVDYLGKRTLSEHAELTVISVVVFGQFLLLLPALLRISRGPATVTLFSDQLEVKLDQPRMLLAFTELRVPFAAIKSYDLAVEGNPGLVLRLEEGKESFNLHAIDKDAENFAAAADQIIRTFQQYNERAESLEQVPYKSVYSSNLMRIVAVVYLIVILLFGAVLFTQPEAKLTYQAVFFIAIGLPFLWQVGKRMQRGKRDLS